MKALSIGLGIFILTCSAGAEVFLETFDDRDIIEQWQELNGKVGLGISNYSVLFDNLRITTEDDIPKSVTPRTTFATTWGT